MDGKRMVAMVSGVASAARVGEARRENEREWRAAAAR
jgi:hypothetical protein